MTTNFSLENGPLGGLDESQRAAATLGPGPVAVVAGPGSGKTRTLTRRAALIVREGLSGPGETLVLTFTNKAARELSERLSELLGRQGEGITVATLHSLGASLLKRHYRDRWRIIDEEERLAVIKELSGRYDLKPAFAASEISRARQTGAELNQELEELYKTYCDYKENNNIVDFDDLILLPLGLLEEGAAIKPAEEYSAVLVDEFQDLNDSQYRLLRHLVPEDGRGLMVIGDPNQAIYSFRGADPALFKRLSQDFPATQTVGLNRSYRVPEPILKPALRLISHNREAREIDIAPSFLGGVAPAVAGFSGPRSEAAFVAREIERLVGGLTHKGRELLGHEGEEVGFGEVAVLMRLGALAGPVARALAQRGIPYQEAGEAPLKETENLDFTAEKVTLMSLHAAKGLEFKVVFIIGAQEGLLPLNLGSYTSGVEEERRLLYVGMTRARGRLYLTFSRERAVFGERLLGGVSRFINEAGLEVDEALGRIERPKRPSQMGLF